MTRGRGTVGARIWPRRRPDGCQVIGRLANRQVSRPATGRGQAAWLATDWREAGVGLPGWRLTGARPIGVLAVSGKPGWALGWGLDSFDPTPGHFVFSLTASLDKNRPPLGVGACLGAFRAVLSLDFPCFSPSFCAMREVGTGGEHWVDNRDSASALR
ncbi:MAG: hypothetical protein VB144_10575 [Clostridia bacterium]|nr:hypothetical protein [Clostridia bacterium]